MALTPKEAARQILDELPDDATLDDVRRRLSVLSSRVGDAPSSEPRGSSASPEASEDAEFHLERRGRFTVLVRDRPGPTITVEMVNQVIDEIRREREESAIYPWTFEE